MIYIAGNETCWKSFFFPCLQFGENASKLNKNYYLYCTSYAIGK